MENLNSNSKLNILNHRNRLLNLVQTSLFEDITNDEEVTSHRCSHKKPKLTDQCGSESEHEAEMQTDPSNTLRNELMQNTSPFLISSETLRLKSNFEACEDSATSEASSSNFSTPGSRTPLEEDSSNEFDLTLNISLSSHNQENTLFKPINSLLKYNLNYLHLMRKETLVFLIEQNFQNRIKSPFDLFAYNRLKSGSAFKDASIDTKTSKFNYNYLNVRKLSKLLNFYENPLDKKYLKQNNLLPCCVGQFLMPFYFDIFKVSELNQLSREEIDMNLLLKRTYKSHIYLDYESLIGNYKENILWNCFILFKYKFSSTQTLRMEFFNYFLALNYSYQHLEHVVSHLQSLNQPKHAQMISEHLSKALDLSMTLPFLFDTLILTGMFKHSDYVRFKAFAQSRLMFSSQGKQLSLERVYYENSLKNICHKAEHCFPLKLKNLCRIKIKEQCDKFDSAQVNKFAIPKTIKCFLMFEDELREFYLKYKNLINQNSVSFYSW